jgi:hypothetical protein
LWPDFTDLQPYWEEFRSFALSELDGNIEISYTLEGSGRWRFVARQAPDRAVENLESLTYNSAENRIEYHDPEVNSGWTMEDAF